jgi:aryl-alcohol dehydrogenase-like predicted oxidoreductase
MSQAEIPVDSRRALGASGVVVTPIGLGTNKWGVPSKDKEEIFQTFRTALDLGIDFIDTAEIYTGGRSERLIGEFTHRDTRRTVICTKFAPLPTRMSAGRVLAALDASLERLGAESIDVYLVHFPFAFLSTRSLMQALAQAVRMGKIRAVGVSNYGAKQMRTAATYLAQHGVPLAANEVQYSLLHRKPEMNGVLDTCRELNVALIAYFPLGAGLLSAAEASMAEASDPSRQHRRRRSRLAERMITGGSGTSEQRVTLAETLQRIALSHGGTVSQVALNWLLQRDEHVIAIPGATSAGHVRQNAEALRWSLRPEEFAAIDRASLPWKR